MQGNMPSRPQAKITFARAVRSELVRQRRSPLIALHTVLAVALGAGIGWYFSVTPWDPQLACDAFFQLLGAGASLLVGLSCGLAIDAEREAGACMNLLGVTSRRRALAAKGAVLLVLGMMAAVVAVLLFCLMMTLGGRALPSVASLAAATAGIGAGSIALYALALFIALRWGRNAAIAFGAIGFLVAISSLGGLGNGLVTGTLSGAFAPGLMLLVPFSWPSRLASLSIEWYIAASWTVPDAAAQLAAVQGTLTVTAVACAAITVVLVAAAALLIGRLDFSTHTQE